MILFWMKAFKKPTEQQNKDLLDAYMALDAKNQKKVNRKTGLTIGGYFSIAVLCLLVCIGLLAYEIMLGYYVSIGFALDVAFTCLAIYATYTSSTWIAAKPYQRILLCINYVSSLLDQQQIVELDTAAYNIEHSTDSENQINNADGTQPIDTQQPATENTAANTQSTENKDDDTSDKKE